MQVYSSKQIGGRLQKAAMPWNWKKRELEIGAPVTLSTIGVLIYEMGLFLIEFNNQYLDPTGPTTPGHHRIVQNGASTKPKRRQQHVDLLRRLTPMLEHQLIFVRQLCVGVNANREKGDIPTAIWENYLPEHGAAG